ncbi:hypothetical protein AgCh_040331 [Apium graveolens]
MELPNDLVDEILTRVPVKYVLRCRCVSKEWCSVIDSAKFVEKYLKVSVKRNRVGLMIQGDKKYLLTDLEYLEDDSAVIDISEEVGGILNGARLVNSTNGLVCLSLLDNNINAIFLLNPCTRKCKKLPAPGKEFLDNNSLDKYSFCGVGYDCVGDDYKVLLIQVLDLRGGIMASVYSLKKNAWTPIPNVISTEKLFVGPMAGLTFADGAVIWTAFDFASNKPVNFGFDLGLEQFRGLEVCKEDLRLCRISIESSRAKEILENPAFRCFKCPRPVTYLKSHEKILFEMNSKKFVWYDRRSKAIKIVSLSGIPNPFVSSTYIESLFPLIEDI